MLAWNTLNLRWMEMMAASAQVIAARSARQNTPAQILGMASEKGEAALESAAAMSRHMMRMGTLGPMALPLAWLRMLSSGVAPYHARARRNARSR